MKTIMLKRAFFAIAVALSAAACTQLPQRSEILSFPPKATKYSFVLGPPGGYQVPNIEVSVPGGNCNPEAFVAAFKSGYYLGWNMAIGPKEGLFQTLARRKPAVPSAAFNLALYKDKSFNLRGFDDQSSVYGGDKLAHNDYSVRCAANSYNNGRAAGEKAAIEAFRGLVAQERL